MPVVSAPQPPEAEAVIRAKASECNAPLQLVSESWDETPLALGGAHQKQNAAVALAALRAAEINVDREAITRGLADVQWPARFQRWNDRTVIDGAHNPAGCRVLAETWRAAYGDERAVIILATLRDKDAVGMISALLPIASSFVLPEVRTERAVPPAELAALVRAAAPALPVTVKGSFPDAFHNAQATNARILITGSLHFAGEALAALGGNPDDLEDCAQ